AFRTRARATQRSPIGGAQRRLVRSHPKRGSSLVSRAPSLFRAPHPRAPEGNLAAAESWRKHHSRLEVFPVVYRCPYLKLRTTRAPQWSGSSPFTGTVRCCFIRTPG